MNMPQFIFINGLLGNFHFGGFKGENSLNILAQVFWGVLFILSMSPLSDKCYYEYFSSSGLHFTLLIVSFDREIGRFNIT